VPLNRMKKLLLAILLLAPLSGWGAWTSVGALGSTNDKTAGTSISFTVSATLDAGNVGVCTIAADNDGDGIADDISSVVDSTGSNTWVEIAEVERDPGAGATGASSALYYTVASSNVTSGSGTITANFAASVTASAIECWEFSITSGNVVSIVDSPTVTGSGTACTATSINPSTGSREHLYLEAAAVETADTSHGSPGGWNVMSKNVTSGGGDASNMATKGSYKIATSSTETGGTSWITSADYACALGALDEDAPAAASGQGWWGSGQMGF
jgi:hypothetical protein